jgi:predicted DNA-binding helix-hairpin-helix protein
MSTSATQTIDRAQEFFTDMIQFYSNYINELETFLRIIPISETDLIDEVVEYMKEVKIALEHDLDIFDTAIASDREQIHFLKDDTKINELYKQLKQES